MNRGDGVSNKFGERLKEIREKNNLSRVQLASALNISPSTLAGYENGHRTPNIDFINKIADYFNVTADWLLGRVEDEKKGIYTVPTVRMHNLIVLYKLIIEFMNKGKDYFLSEPAKTLMEDNSFKDIVNVKEIGEMVEKYYSKYTVLPVLRGPGAYPDEEEYFGCDMIPSDVLKEGDEYLIYNCGDNSMPNICLPGDRIVFKKIKNKNEIPNKEIVMFKNGNEYLVRRYYKTNKDVVLQADNPDYPPIVYNPNGLNTDMDLIGLYYLKLVFDENE